ncbi:Intraflagellar transport protein 172 like [Schistosoma japonicum]|nr:Intraflagellar transport protein 172 like [Schistosoma japonicum]
MNLKHLKTLIPTQECEAKVQSIAWSPNNKKLAVCSNDRIVIIFDENGERRTRFSTKTSESKCNGSFFQIKGMVFSHDSTKLAIAQSDNIIFVYKVGESWDEKVVICNKFPQKCPVTCIIWPSGQPIICGLADGKVRAANTRTNKSSTIYNADSYVVSISGNIAGKGFISGHADGRIIRYFFEDDGSGDIQGKLTTHPTAPYALAWAGSTILAAGCDKRTESLYSILTTVKMILKKEFYTASCNPSGHIVAFGSFNRIRLISWSPRKCGWDECKSKEIKNLYSITAMAWKNDGSKLVVGSYCGGVDLFDCCVKKKIFKNSFELNYVGPGQVIVKNLKSGDTVVLQSLFGYEISDVKVMGQNQYLVAHTSNTLIIGNFRQNQLSEVQWDSKKLHERFYFGYDKFCIIFGSGELFVIEYGVREILGSVRTEFTTPYLISVRVNERKFTKNLMCKKIAYMLDLKTIVVHDFLTGSNVAQISHDKKIDWIELNETGQKLLFRDKKLQLILFDIETGVKLMLLNFCYYVQWVPQSDVVVAQSRDSLCIWYYVESTDRMTSVPLRGGDIIDVVRQQGRTEVLINEGMTSVTYNLDNSLIEFSTAMEDGDFERAVSFLESLEKTPETKSMWTKLAFASLKSGNLIISEQCFASLGHMSKSRYLRQIHSQLIEGKISKSNVQACIAILEKDFRVAEDIFLFQNSIEDVVKLYKDLQKWDVAIEIAEAKSWSGLDNLKKDYHHWLTETGQEEKAGDLRQKDGDFNGAITLYLRAGVPGKAARLALSEPKILSDKVIMERIIMSLTQCELYEKAGELYQSLGQSENALRCYRQGNHYQKAIELARISFPSNILQLEEEWGDYLISEQQMDNAINHFIEAGAYIKAADAAISSRQWTKASHILASIENKKLSEQLAPYFLKLAQHHVACREYDVAEQVFLKANQPKLAINMYTSVGLWEKAHHLASTIMDQTELTNMYLSHAEEFENVGKYKEAERLYLTIKETDRAISMYKNAHQYREMLRLVKQFNADLLDQTYLHLAEQLQTEGNLKQAEQYYLEAKDWKSAVNMYRTINRWEDAYRVASNCTEQPELRKQVAYLWAKHLGGESAVRLLTRLRLLESAIDYATEQCTFDFAFELAQSSECSNERLSEVHNKYAMFLEDEGKFVEAEEQFVKAGKPREAVLMYVHNQDWDSAARVASEHDPDSVNDVLLGQARLAFGEKDFVQAEALLLRAQRPDMAVRAYREAGMWEEAIRVAETYLPNRVQELKEEFREERMRAITGGHGSSNRKQSTDYQRQRSTSIVDEITNAYLQQAKDYESRGEYLRAVEYYLKLAPNTNSTDNNLNDSVKQQQITPEICEHAWMYAANLAVKFLPTDSSVKVVELVASRLTSIQRHTLAGELLLSVDKIQKAIDAFIAGENWSKAKCVARELEPRLEAYVDAKYKEALKISGQAETLAGVDIISALDMYAKQGKWEKCLSTAEQLLREAEKTFNSQLLKEHQLLHKYVAEYAANLIKDSRVYDAMLLYKKYGTPAYKQNFNIYKRIFQGITNQRGLYGPDAYQTWSTLRDILFDLSQNLKQIASDIQLDIIKLFERMLLVSHYYAIRSALLSSKQDIVTQISVSLLRHSDILPADKVFYEAGLDCRQIGWNNMAFVFLNRYLDLVEAIEDPDNSSDSLDSTDFQGTDIPMEVPIPEHAYTTDKEHESIREWILAVSMDQKLDQTLPKDERGVYVASLNSPGTGLSALPCIISGYPVLRNGIIFEQSKRIASKVNWDKFLYITKISRTSECSDVKEFIERWSGTNTLNGI